MNVSFLSKIKNYFMIHRHGRLQCLLEFNMYFCQKFYLFFLPRLFSLLGGENVGRRCEHVCSLLVTVSRLPFSENVSSSK